MQTLMTREVQKDLISISRLRPISTYLIQEWEWAKNKLRISLCKKFIQLWKTTWRIETNKTLLKDASNSRKNPLTLFKIVFCKEFRIKKPHKWKLFVKYLKLTFRYKPLAQLGKDQMLICPITIYTLKPKNVSKIILEFLWTLKNNPKVVVTKTWSDYRHSNSRTFVQKNPLFLTLIKSFFHQLISSHLQENLLEENACQSTSQTSQEKVAILVLICNLSWPMIDPGAII
jgi:hypothetical protein